MMEKLYLDSDDGYRLSLAVFESQEAVATIQIIHGMEEHKERYYNFMEYLTEHHFNVVISDLRGHGSDAPLLSHIADRHGDILLIRDQQKITEFIMKRFPGSPVMLLGHSMGTIIARVLLQTDSMKYAKAAFSGYVNPNPAGLAAIVLGGMIQKFRGSKSHSSLLDHLTVGAFAQSIENRKTDLDWLSYNEDNVRRYQEDPLCGVEFTTGSYMALFRLLNKMGKTGEYRNINTDLPLLLVSGIDDPCTGGEKGRTASQQVLREAGFQHISVITYEHMRHEILQENDHRRVYEDLLDFFS